MLENTDQKNSEHGHFSRSVDETTYKHIASYYKFKGVSFDPAAQRKVCSSVKILIV